MKNVYVLALDESKDFITILYIAYSFATVAHGDSEEYSHKEGALALPVKESLQQTLERMGEVQDLEGRIQGGFHGM